MQMVVLVPSQISLLLRRLKKVGVAELLIDTTGAIAVSITEVHKLTITVNGGTATALGTSATGFTYTAPSDGTYTLS
jgi:hypothetical protein